VCEYTPAEGAVVGVVAEASWVVSGSSVPDRSGSSVAAGCVAGGEVGSGGEEAERFSPDAAEHAAKVPPHVSSAHRYRHRQRWRRRRVAIAATVGLRVRKLSAER
jgi:hypothetical protein